MPVEEVEINGQTKYRWGKEGKPYDEKWKAEKQGRAIEAAKHLRDSNS